MVKLFKLDRKQVLLSGCLLNTSFNFAIPLLATILVAGVNLSVTEASMILGMANLLAAIFQPFAGRLADYGHQWISLFLVFLLNLIGIVSLFSESVTKIGIGVTLLLFSSATLQTFASRQIIGLAATEERRRLSTHFYAVANLGYAIGACLAFYFLAEYRSVLLGLDIVTTGLYCLIIAADTRLMIPVDGSRTQISEPPKTLPKETVGKIAACISLTLFPYIAMASGFSLVQTNFVESGLDPTKYSTLFFGITSLFIVVGAFLMEKLKPKLMIRVVGGGALIGAGVCALSTANSFMSCISYSLIWALGELLVVGDITSIFHNIVPHNRPGLASGIRVGTFRTAFVLCPFFVALMSPIDSLEVLAWISIPCLISSIALYVFMVKIVSEEH